MLAPVMHPIHVRLHHWFVPNRILWEEWEDFITGGPLNDDPTSGIPLIQFQGGDSVGKTLMDYMGIPLQTINGSMLCRSMPTT